MQVFDASSMIHAWDNYPMRQFPGLWAWTAAQIEAKALMMPRVAFDEVAHKTPDCSQWLKEHDLGLIEVGNDIAQTAMRIKLELGIVGDKYHAKGVDENDLLIIATAKIHNVGLVSDESKQKLPDIPSKRKIPAVCIMQSVGVSCVSFIEYIKNSDAIFR